MERAFPKTLVEDPKELSGQAISIIVNLLLFAKPEFKGRVLAKFEEKNHEKTQKAFEFYLSIREQLQKIDTNRESLLKTLEIDDPNEAEVELDIMKLDAGVGALRNLSLLFKMIPLYLESVKFIHSRPSLF